ncbi:MAG: protease HtpX, partial [Bdellovibrionales bacterium]|nr:protease HtpX [Bdellovibrionales bacterium]NQZ18608.1 protease HtpX [Bdellovibrionales bacterium]
TPYPPQGSLIPYVLFAGIFGMGGAFVSLFLSKWMVKRSYGVRIIDPRTNEPRERELVESVHKMARAARLRKMPEVGIYDSPEMNAFATGPSKNNSLVAVSTGLLRNMNKNQVDGVIGHEVAHVANGDMVTLTLIMGVVNTFVILFAQIVSNVIASQFERNRYMIRLITYYVVSAAFSLLGSIVVAYFSRIREYRADKGGAQFAGRENMISALQALSQQAVAYNKEDNIAALKISGAEVTNLFRSHPRLEDRIARLQKGY